MFFDAKMARESGPGAKSHAGGADPVCGPGGNPAGNGASVITLPYEFPTAGNYRLWVQFKTGGRIMTAIFDTTVL
jgi:hypothetical protein